MRSLAAAALMFAALVSAPAGGAKDFGPGVRVCGAHRCATLTDRAVSHALSAFVYGESRPVLAHTPGVGSPVFALDIGAMLGGTRLDRFRSHGIICGRFERGRWYRVPARIAREMRRLTANTEPRQLTAKVPRSC